MRRVASIVLLLGLAQPVLAQDQPRSGPPRDPVQRGSRRIFISPMGQPFRGTPEAPDPERTWFDAVDTNRDGVVSFAEFKADAGRFFTILDRKRDGEIDPDDIDYYENTLAPEVRSGAASGSGIIARKADGEGGASEHGTGPGPLYDAGQLGAARFSYFDLPEPVTAADRNFNRGVDPMEFGRAAQQRFDSLDKNHDGKLSWDELPHVSVKAEVRMGGRGRGGGRREPMSPGMGAGRTASGEPMN